MTLRTAPTSGRPKRFVLRCIALHTKPVHSMQQCNIILCCVACVQSCNPNEVQSD
jgi:hypothetical protein